MALKLPSKYPPELPGILANEIRSGSSHESFSKLVVLGHLLPGELVKDITSRKNTLDISRESEQAGFSILDCDDSPPALIYSSCEVDEESRMVMTSAVLFASRILGISQLFLLDGIETFSQVSSPLLRIDDHINMTGIDPLAFWMALEEPDPFFLDVKSLYSSDGIEELPGIIHLATPEIAAKMIFDTAREAGAGSFGQAFIPEALIAGYLKLKIHAVGFVIAEHSPGSIKNVLSAEILKMIKSAR